MLQLMVDEQPENATVTGRAIAVAGITDNPREQLRLFRNAVDHRQPFDSVFTAVEQASFSLVRSDIYENFLRLIAREEPWTSRSIDSYLLAFYTYRRDGQGMVEYADKMLAGLPDNLRFLRARADGLMLTGDYDAATATLRHIITLDPRDTEAMLQLAFYLRSAGQYAEADSLLQRAYKISPTPYLKQISGIRK